MSPLIRPGPVPASLGGNNKAGRVWKQRFRNQFLAYVWSVRIRGVNKIDIEFHGPAKNRQRPFAIFWWPPDTFAGKAHRSEAETMHRNFATERDIASHTCRKFLLVLVHD